MSEPNKREDTELEMRVPDLNDQTKQDHNDWPKILAAVEGMTNELAYLLDLPPEKIQSHYNLVDHPEQSTIERFRALCKNCKESYEVNLITELRYDAEANMIKCWGCEETYSRNNNKWMNEAGVQLVILETLDFTDDEFQDFFQAAGKILDTYGIERSKSFIENFELSMQEPEEIFEKLGLSNVELEVEESTGSDIQSQVYIKFLFEGPDILGQKLLDVDEGILKKYISELLLTLVD